MTRTASS